MSIPKVVHYLWLSDKKPDNVKACLDSWKEPLKDYKIIEWNKETFPYNDFIWTREAFSVKKWAFVTDFFRLWVLKNYGGIYLDADVTMRGNFDKFLDDRMFIGVEAVSQFGPHVMGAEKEHPFIIKCLNYYHKRHFVLSNGYNDEMPMPYILTKIFMQSYKYLGKLVLFNNSSLKLNDMCVYNDTFFNINLYNGYNICYHNCFGSWRENSNNPIMSQTITAYCLYKFFCYDIFNKKKILYYFFLPVLIVLAFFLNRRIKVINNKKVKRVKI